MASQICLTINLTPPPIHQSSLRFCQNLPEITTKVRNTLYRDIDSLQEYILIDSESIRIEKYVRNQDESWLFRDYKSTHTKFSIETIQEELMLADIYMDDFG